MAQEDTLPRHGDEAPAGEHAQDRARRQARRGDPARLAESSITPDAVLQPEKDALAPQEAARKPRDRAGAPDERFAAKAPSYAKGEAPPAIMRRYYTDELRHTGELGFFTDAQTKATAFRDAGDALTTRETNADVVRDMVAIAAHRGWSTINVRGTDDFRRQAWMEARMLGLDVRGYEPSDRDKQALERRLDARDSQAITPARARERGAEGHASAGPEYAPRPVEPRPERVDFDKGFVGKLREVGSAPYQDRPGAELSPFIKVELPDGRVQQVWGASLPERLADAGAQVGDTIAVRRDGKEPVLKTVEVRDPETGAASLTQRHVLRNRWVIDADRFREIDPKQAARDPALAGAQSSLAVVAAVVKDRIMDPRAQDRIIDAAKARIAGQLADGKSFNQATVRESRELSAPAPGVAPAKQAEVVDKELRRGGPERSRGR